MSDTFSAPRSTEADTLDNRNGYAVAVFSEEFHVVDENRNIFS